MSDPMNRPIDNPPPELPPRKSASPLLWMLVLIALLAFGWYFYNRRASELASLPAPTPATDTGMAAQNQAPDTASVRRPEPARSAEPAKPAPRAAVNRAPEPLSRVQPAYPPEAFRNGETGTVVVRAQVGADGMPTGVNVARRSGSRDLDRAALDAVRQWRFKPAMEHGKAVASTIEVPIEFKLDQQ
ncbi:MAG TPA: TonB family protein [Luteimonas sp.]|nr:TonB family protein [Luteimonas sp.]